jgi:hypothetical protein
MKKEPDPTKDAPAPIGARQENSSLFSLEALKKQEELALASAASEPKRTEDSGIIDLKALALIQKSEKSEASRALDVASVQAPDLFQIGMVSQLTAPQPLALAAPPEAEAPKPQSRTLPIVLGVAAIVAIGGVAFFLGRGSGTQATAQGATPTATATAAPPAPATATATATPPPEPEVAAITPGQRPTAPTATATATAAAKPPPAAPGGRVPGPLPKPKPAPAEPAPAPAPVNTCDLACQMKRAVEQKH